MKYLISLSLAAFMLASCMTERKRADVFHRYARENPTELAELCADEFPPKVTTIKGKTDTVTKRDTLRVRVPVKIPGRTDTVWADCPPSETIYRYINRTDTIMQENTALIAELQGKLAESDKKLAVETALRKKAEDTSHNRLYWIIGLGIALAGAAYLIFKP